MRLVAGLAVIFAAGLGAGWWLSRAEASARPKSESVPVLAESAEMVKLRAELRQTDDERGFLAERAATLEKEMESLRQEQAELETALREAVAFTDEPAAHETPSVESPAPESRRRGGPPRPEPTPEQREAYRKSFEEQQTRMRERLNEQLAQMNDPNAFENFSALMEYRQEEQQLQRQLRDAKTDEARAKIEAQLTENRQSARQLQTAQQDSILRNLAASSGIQDAAAQQRLADDVRAALDNPFFRMGPSFNGGRGGSRGFGGGGFGGGRPPQAPPN